MEIKKPEIRQEEGKIIISVRVESTAGTNILWYRMDEKFADLITDASDAYLVALLLPAMAKGEDIHIAGTISDRLFYNLAGPYQRFVRYMFPAFRPIKIFPHETSHQEERAPGVAAGFTAGIDSFDVLVGHYYAENIPKDFKVTHLLHHNVGSHDWIYKNKLLPPNWHAKTSTAAECVGLPLIVVESNTDEFYPPGLGYTQTHSHRNATIPLLLQGGLGRSLMAASNNYKNMYIGVSNTMTYIEPIIFPFLSTDGHDIISVGSEYSRVEKTLRVAEIPDSYDNLHICFRAQLGKNCSVCPKCVRTLFTLEIAGLIERYAPSFDLAAYRKVRDRIIVKKLAYADPLFTEVLAFARRRHTPLPLGVLLIAFIKNAVARMKRRLIRPFPD